MPSNTPGSNQVKYFRTRTSYRHPKSNSTTFENNIFVEFALFNVYLYKQGHKKNQQGYKWDLSA